MTRKDLSGYREAARGTFDGSEDLFCTCWWRYLQYLRGGINSPTSQDDVDEWLDAIASELITDPATRFYTYG